MQSYGAPTTPGLSQYLHRCHHTDSKSAAKPSIDHPRPPARRRLGIAAAAVAAALSLAACGGSSASERILEGALERISDENVDIDFDFDGDGENFSVGIGDGQMAMGTDLDRPDWLPSGFPLPDGAAITAYAAEAADSMAALFLDAPGTLSEIRSAQIAALEGWGATLVTDRADVEDRSVLVFITPDGRVLQTGYGEIESNRIAVTIEFTGEDPTDIGLRVNGPVEGAGVATAVISGTTYTAVGGCQIGSGFASFATEYNPEPSAEEVIDISVNISDSGSGMVSVNATVSITKGMDMTILILGNDQSTGRIGPSSMSAGGTFTNIMTMDDPVNGTVEVTCS